MIQLCIYNLNITLIALSLRNRLFAYHLVLAVSLPNMILLLLSIPFVVKRFAHGKKMVAREVNIFPKKSKNLKCFKGKPNIKEC